MTIGLLILRIAVGALFVGHGTQKLFGWFGGHGIEGTAGFMRSLGYRSGRAAAVLAGLAETFGGLFLAMGFLTPLAAAAIIGVMFNASVRVHRMHESGTLAVASSYHWSMPPGARAGVHGARCLSIDGLVGWHLDGLAYGLGALATGLVAVSLPSPGVRRLRRRQSARAAPRCGCGLIPTRATGAKSAAA